MKVKQYLYKKLFIFVSDLNSYRTTQILAKRLQSNQTESKQEIERDTEQENKENETQYDNKIKYNVLKAAMVHVPKSGWSLESISRGAADIGYPGTIHGLFERREAHLVEHFQQECNKQLVEFMKEQSKNHDPLSFVEHSIRERLTMIEPYAASWAHAIAIGAKPSNVPHSLALLLTMVDDICWHAGDRSVDFSWYARRVALALIYKSSELYMLQDGTPGRDGTWRFLNRQLKDASKLQQTQEYTKQAIGASADAISSIFTTARNIIGLNR